MIVKRSVNTPEGGCVVGGLVGGGGGALTADLLIVELYHYCENNVFIFCFDYLVLGYYDLNHFYEEFYF